MRVIECFDSCMRFVKRYPTLKAASEDVGVTPAAILHVVNKAGKTCCGFIWKYADEFLKGIKKMETQIIQAKKGKIINRFDNIKQASKVSKFKVYDIYRCLIGETLDVNGYAFYFENDPFIYKNPHTEEERAEYRRRLKEITEHLVINDYIIDDKVREWYAWEKKYSDQRVKGKK